MHIRGNGMKLGVSAVALLCASAIVATDANAGAFAIREQSAYYQGMSFAGAGTGDVLSSMYWNSAAAAAAPGMNSETHVSLILPDTEITATGGVTIADPEDGGFGLGTESGNLADPALVPASYANYQVNDRLYFGIATNSGFGLVTKPDNTDWAGSVIAVTSDVFTINLNPTVAYKVTPELTVGVGVQVEYLNVRLNNGGQLNRSAELDDIGFGATAGLSWTPQEGTTIGIGYRSAISFDLEGDYNSARTRGTTVSANGEITLPDIVTIGLRQRLTERLDLLAGYEWTNWSLVDTVEVTGAGGTLETLDLNYDDGHFISLGLEYAYSPALTLRTGIAWEKSPISDEVRNVLLPDSDRIWLSLGATYQYNEKISLDLGYTHIFADDAPICREAALDGAPPCDGGTPLIEAEGETSVDIISASFKYKWGAAETALEPEYQPLK